jgi:hypothetical protein
MGCHPSIIFFKIGYGTTNQTLGEWQEGNDIEPRMLLPIFPSGISVPG